ncbi:GNAT family N-acetyltransferase [Variovorax guangxiensis]|uniref:GNAT family N-acetyltransferase n=1 Tax=Variovorax guangxiensis TaxID=1775474 RepID=A0A502DGW1_9BURK|nr:GNAT family N-acetyltransferase [Variovorax guangxiensis]TPG20293.1 GNAT family N-acetyltransferase [Variovorax ginsengisoli]TPG23952.1 GNAT family N-acetyltransferase [Variovorax guangxiensis]
MSVSSSRPLPLVGTPDIFLLTPDTLGELNAARAIFSEYAAALGIDLGFQDFDAELNDLPGDYAEPRGALLLALVDAAHPMAADAGLPLQLADGRLTQLAGCSALRPLDTADYPNAAEMKRLYVRPAFRGLGLGRRLAESILDAARGAGYGCVLLDTLDDMASARTLYEDLGFVEVPPYYHNPIAGSHYLKVEL